MASRVHDYHHSNVKEKPTMKISQTAKKVNVNKVMDVSVDVHKDTLSVFSRQGTRGKRILPYFVNAESVA